MAVARAAYRIHHAGAAQASTADAGECGRLRRLDGTRPFKQLAKAYHRVRPQLTKPLSKLLRTDNSIIHSPALVPSRWPELINSSDADVVNLHWVQAEMLSIADISRIGKPVVWTLHDMWAFCGAEHYAWDNRWRDGYGVITVHTRAV